MSEEIIGDTNIEGATASGKDDPVDQIERQRLFEASPDLQALCRDNGISAQQFVLKSAAVATLEMFLGFWGSMSSVMHFPFLRELYVVNHPTIRELEGIDKCANLEVLVVTECGLEHIGHSIVHCTRLRKVNFSSNKLRALDNLDTLEQLEILWVNENALEALGGLRKLLKLSQLWACRNRIDRFDTALNACSSLKELNVSGNRLSSFKSLLPLANLDALAVLTLSDPHFGDNPVCRLCNYQTYLMCHLSCLTFLDTMEVSQRHKQIAEATMVKKKVYYNMRIRNIRRDARSQIQRYEAIRSHAAQQYDANVMALVRQKKEIEYLLSEHRHILAEGAPRENQATVQLEKKVECLRTCLDQQYSAIHRLNRDFDRLSVDLLQMSDRYASRLLLELETAGNVRLEDGKPSDAWYSTCIDLLRSRLHVDNLGQFGIVDIRIGRVTRVSNRYLRNRFLSRMEEIVVVPEADAKENVSKKGVTVQNRDHNEADDDHSGLKSDEYVDDDRQPQQRFPGSSLDKSIEYLFYLQPHHMDQTMRSSSAEQCFAAENGFRDPIEYAKLGVDGAIKLSSSIAMLDTERICAEMSERGQPDAQGIYGKSGEGADSQHNPLVLPPRVLMIVKVFPGYTKTTSSSEVAQRSSPSGTGAAPVVRSEDYVGLHSLQILPPANPASPDGSPPRQKLYYVFDKALVLPEYLVEFQYVMRGDNTATQHVKGEDSCSNPALSMPEGDSLEGDTCLTVHCTDLSPGEEYLATSLVSQHADAFERKYRLRRRHGSIGDGGADETIKRVLQMGPPHPEVIATAEVVQASVISDKLKSLELGRIKDIHLIGCKLQVVPDLSAISAQLNTLVLSYNCIQTVSGLAGLDNLRVLDLSFNQVGQLGHLDGLQSLESLDLSHNLLSAFRDVEYLGRVFIKSSLNRLDLRKNALCATKRYRLHVLQSLPSLGLLDHQPVERHEVVAASLLITKLSGAKIWELSTRSGASSHLMSQALTRHPEAQDEKHDLDTSNLSPYTIDAWATIEFVALDRELVSIIEGLELAVNLRVATFADNVISSISGLNTCRRLEELCLDDNEIGRIEHLDHLTMLKKLHLGRNRISAIEGLDSLENLVQLSLEGNNISSLRGLGGLVKLMELYLSNNKIEVLKDIQHLKSLPKLTILDMAGNEICRLGDYRLYCVYHLRRVKVLDGSTVSPQDQSSAKLKYSGKLTLDFVLEKCGIGGSATPRMGSGFDRIVEMDLSSCHLRDLIVLTGKNFPNVQDINLENNQISDITAMEALTSLKKLNLNRNRIERLVPSDANDLSTTVSPRSLYTITTLKGILGCVKLEQLYLGYNHISDMSTLGLEYLPDLKVLHLQGNSITQLSGLENNSELLDLRLDKNRIRQIDTNAMLGLRLLRVLSVEDNGLKSLATFDNMISLEVLEVSNNRLVELEEIDRLVSLRSLSDLRMANNPIAKKHLYRPSVITRLSTLSALDGREVTRDERERATTLFVHERATAAASACVASYASGERVVDARPGYQSFVASAIGLTPSSVPCRPAVSVTGVGASALASASASPQHDALSGSLLRRNYVSPAPFAAAQSTGSSGQSIPLPDQQSDLKMAIAPSHTTTKSLMPSSQGVAHRAAASTHSNQASGGRSFLTPPSGTVTVASALNASAPATLNGGSQRSERRGVANGQYLDHPIAGVALLPGVIGTSQDVKLPVGQPFAKSLGTLTKQGLSMYPSSAEAVLTRAGGSYPKTELLSKSGSDGAAATPISGYVVAYGNQKRYPSYAGAHTDESAGIPYQSAKLQHHAAQGSARTR